MDDESEIFARRDRIMRREAMKLTPSQRMTRMFALQEEMFARLEQNPEAFERFWRRNLKKRAVHRDGRASG